MIDFPRIPAVPPEQTAETDSHLRYEDVCQDGRILLPGLIQSGMPALWAKLLYRLPLTGALFRQGVLPIISRLVAEGDEGPFGVAAPLLGKGGYQLVQTGRGAEVERLMLNIWTELRGPRGRVNGPKPPGAGEVVSAGRVFTEQVLTRPFAPPDQRKVLRIDVPGFPAIPEVRHPFREPADIAALPEGVTPLEPGPSPDTSPVVFGLCHTDGNQHVNSLVYPRMFEEAAVRRFAALGLPVGLARAFEMGFRKPCFAGDKVRIVLQAFRRGERWGAVGAFLAEADAHDPARARPHCTARMIFES